ncbi:MAG: FAD-binding oxidoreductase [Gammaproteobacteria bacterium]|nr:FAD-binding oxidoreductase [Gammaproteobacteria bacterium]
MKSDGFRDTGRFDRRPAQPGAYAPSNLVNLMRCLDRSENIAIPIRPRGAGSSATDCNLASSGTSVRMTGLDRIINVDTLNHTVTAEAGVRLGALISALAEDGLELIGSFDQTERTLGGAIAAPCMGPGIGGSASMLSSQVISLKAVTADGKVMKVASTQKHLLSAFRLSYGMLGVIFEVTLRVRPITTFTASHRSMDIDTFAQVADRLSSGNIGLKFYLMPYRNHVYLDLRHYDASNGNTYNTPWKIKDWGESTVLPNVFKSLNLVMPIPSVRYQLMDTISATTHGLVNSMPVRNGNNAAAGGRHRRRKPSNLLYSTWCFPASDFSVVVKAYARFCRETFAHTAYRCDLPAVGYRVARDNSALLSPSFEEPLIALQTTSTQKRGWDGFALDLSEFAENWGGVPLFNQTLAPRDTYVSQSYTGRMEFFRKIRRQLDPGGRLLNPYLARYFK